MLTIGFRLQNRYANIGYNVFGFGEVAEPEDKRSVSNKKKIRKIEMCELTFGIKKTIKKQIKIILNYEKKTIK